MRRIFLIVILIGCICFPGGCKKKPPKKDATACEASQANISSDTVRVLSLKVLQETLKSCQPKGSCSNEALQLACLKTIDGFIIDEENRDLILYGRVNPGAPPLHLEDFVIALRNAWLKYATLEGNVYQYSFPGCSIDPNPNVIQELQLIEHKIASRASSAEVTKDIDDWRAVCEKPQAVRVLGIPFNTHFAEVIVRADYDMKRLADGSDAPGAPGMVSITDATMHLASNAFFRHESLSVPAASMNRFWFYPGENIYEQDQGAVFIKRCPVTLLTEQMHSNARGEIVGSGGADYLASKFANDFTALYDKVAQQRPVYLEMEGLFRFVAIAGILKQTTGLQFDLAYLLEQCPVANTPVSASLPGRHAVKEFQQSETSERGYRVAQFWLPSCGGVDIAIDKPKIKFERNSAGRLSRLKKAILDSRTSAKALTWDYVDKENLLSDLEANSQAYDFNRRSKELSLVVVAYKPDGYELYDGANNPIYSGNDAAEIARNIRSKRMSEPNKMPFFYLKDFPNKGKEQAFLTSYNIQREKIDLITALTGTEDSLLSRGIRFDKNSSTIEQVTEGARKGWYKLTLNFFTQVKGAIQKVIIVVFAKTLELANAFLQKVTEWFNTPDLATADNLADVITAIHRELKTKAEEGDIIVYYTDQSGSTQIGTLITSRSEAVG